MKVQLKNMADFSTLVMNVFKTLLEKAKQGENYREKVQKFTLIVSNLRTKVL